MPEPVRARTNRGAYIVALILAISIGIALNVFAIGIMCDAVFGPNPILSGVTENATQILTGWGGGIIGVIGAVVGYNAGATAPRKNDDERESS